MSRVTPKQVSFNGGELSRRLHARTDQSIHEVAVAEMTGFAPLVEGGAEAMPGTILVAQAAGPCKLMRFEYNTTQGHVLEFSAWQVRVYTNDALLEDGGAPVSVASPYDFDAVQALKTHQSYDVLYCFHPAMRPREFRRDSATAFSFADLELNNGPFDPQNDDESVTVKANALTGAVTLEASAGIFTATDVGSLFRMEANDLGDVPAWEPGISVTSGQYLTANGNVYRVLGGGGQMRTGNMTPSHVKGVEWDGIGGGTDLNSDPAFGVQLEFVHDRVGVLKITAFIDAQHVQATVLRHLPFSAVDNNYAYGGGYWDAAWTVWTPPPSAVAHQYGTWRWAFGAFSDTRGWPTTGAIWNQRLCLAKGSTVYTSVAGDLRNFATVNEFGEQSADMAITYTIEDPNAIEWLVNDEALLILTASGVFALGPASAADGVRPGNVRVVRQNNAGSGAAMPAALDSRAVYIDRSGGRIYQADFNANRGVEEPEDLTRYARQMGNAGFTALAVQQHPFNHLWALRGDGDLACAVYLPEEQVLGFAKRKMAQGLYARSLVSITDPDGKFDQVWIAAEWYGHHYVLRMAPWRHDGEFSETACMMDMALEYDDWPKAEFALPHVPAGVTIDIAADGRLYKAVTEAGGAFTLEREAGHVWAGLPFPAAIESLDSAAGGDTGAATGKTGRYIRAWIDVLQSQGLRFGAPDALADMEALNGDSVTDEGFGMRTGLLFTGPTGAHTRTPRLRIERAMPSQVTLRAWGGELEREQR